MATILQAQAHDRSRRQTGRNGGQLLAADTLRQLPSVHGTSVDNLNASPRVTELQALSRNLNGGVATAQLRALAGTLESPIDDESKHDKNPAYKASDVAQQKPGLVRHFELVGDTAPVTDNAFAIEGNRPALQFASDATREARGAYGANEEGPNREANVKGLGARGNIPTSAAPQRAPQRIVQRQIWPSMFPQLGEFFSDITQNFYATFEAAQAAEMQANEEWQAAERLRQTGASEEVLLRWLEMPVAAKSMTPARKFNEQLMDLSAEGLPENFFVMLRSYFQHTAGFAPKERQGRDFTEKGQGGYFRSTDNSLKASFRKTIRSVISEEGLTDMFRKTSLPLNEALRSQLGSSGRMSTNLLNMERFALTEDPGTTIGVFKSAQGSHVGSLALISNALKMLRAQQKLSGQSIEPSITQTGGELEDLVELANIGETGSDTSYHDLLLQDRGRVVQDVAAWMGQDPWLKDIGVRAIQSGEHPSLIVYHPDFKDSSNEQVWRELFIKQFDEAAKQLELQTRLNYRSSFGFMWPTASSLGGPVRIWPGVAPASIIKEILRLAFYRVDARMRERYGITIEEGAVEQELEKDIPIEERTPLHVETLRTAVRYAGTVLRSAQFRPSDPQVYFWVLTRLKKNLLKARRLLNTGVISNVLQNKQRLEQHYLKSALVVENLMEYAQMLTSLTRAEPNQESDAYLGYASSTLPDRAGRVFYFDSGMQAIVAANLLAKQASGKKQSSFVNVGSYFEYDIINKSNLQLVQFNEPQHQVPDIISADLNPVYTQPEDELHPRPDYRNIRGAFSTARQKPIPILDITNSSLSRVPELIQDYPQFIVVESLTKHYQLGADKFTMGRLIACGPPEFLELASALLGPISDAAYDPLPSIFRQDMDEVFYGNAKGTPSTSTGLQTSSALTGFGTQQEQKSSGEWQSIASVQSLLHVNNCLINAVANATLGRNANLAELVEIRTQVEARGFPIGSMLVASPAILNIIRNVLGITRGITVNYLGTLQFPDMVPGPDPIVIDHEGAHFWERQ